MRYSAIKTCDINNGEGMRVSLWLQGCPHQCKGCHNPETWDIDGGKIFTEKEAYIIWEEMAKGMDLSILGGEPLIRPNHEELDSFLKETKRRFPNSNIWLWTGYFWETIKDLSLIKYLDVVIDGLFIEDLYEEGLKHRGSTNQNIINVKTQDHRKARVMP